MPDTNDFNNARNINTPDATILLPALNAKMDHIVGSTATIIARDLIPIPFTRIALSVESGAFRIAVGDRTTDLLAAAPPDTTYNASGEEGVGGLLLSKATNDSTEVHVLPMPDELTVIGDGAGAVLTFWFLP